MAHASLVLMFRIVLALVRLRLRSCDKDMTLLLLLLLLLLLRLKVPTCLPSAVLAHAVVLDGDEALGWWWGIAKDFGARRLKPFRLLVLRNDDLAAPEELWWHF